MPDANGRIRPVVIPAVPWCATCKLVACVCAPASRPLPPAPEHAQCGTPRCCGRC